MRNITGMIGRYLSGVSLPSMNIIDIIEIMLIAFFVYQFMVWIKFTRAYTLLKGLLVIGAFLVLAYIFKMNTILWIIKNLSTILLIQAGRSTDHGDCGHFPAGTSQGHRAARAEEDHGVDYSV